MTSPLILRAPGLARLHPLPLVAAPTAVERLAALGRELGRDDLWVKRDDRSNPDYGGAKPRKLAWLLAAARAAGARRVLTAGGIGSNHAVATSLFAGRAGLRTTAVLVPQPETDWVRANLRAHAVLGTDLIRVGRAGEAAWAVLAEWLRARRRGERPALIVPGGSSPLGILGMVDAGLELARQVEERRLPAPRLVVVPFGSGGIAAGLALGLALAGLPTEVVAVRVVPRAQAPERLPAAQAAATAALLARHGAFEALRAAARLRLRHLDRYLGEGYGHPTPEGERAAERLRRTEGLEFEPTYGAKAAAAFLDLAGERGRPGPLLLWLTASAAAPPGAARNEMAPARDR